MKRGEPPKRKTPLKRSTKPLKRSAVNRSTGVRKKPLPKPLRKIKLSPSLSPSRTSSAREDWPTYDQARPLVYKRSGGRCEAAIVCRGTGAHQNTHHRKLRRFGDHRPCNLLGVCLECHNFIHGHVGAAIQRGYLVRSWEDPEYVTIQPWVIGP